MSAGSRATRAESSRGYAMFAAMAGSIGGALLQLQQAALWAWPVYAAGVALAIAVGCAWPRMVRGARWLRPAAWIVAMVCGCAFGGGAAGWRAAHFLRSALDPALEGVDVVLVGVVSQMPQRSEGALRFLFEVESAGRADAGLAATASPLAVPPRLSLGWYSESAFAAPAAAVAATVVAGERAGLPPLHAGDRWRITVRLKAPHGSSNPHGFDHELRLWEQGVQATGYVRVGTRDAAPVRLGSTWQHPVERARESVRDAVYRQVDDRRAAGVVAALVTGDQNAIDREDWDVFRATGVAHLMSISGLHITLFAWLAGALVGALWRRSTRLMLWRPAQQAGQLGGLLLATLYAIFSGFGVPSQRTVWMLAAVVLLRLAGKRWPWPFAWLFTAAVVVAFDPWALLQAGFWLSFVAVGVLFATGPPSRQGGATDASPSQAGAAPRTAPLLGAGRLLATGAARRAAQLWREQWTVTLALAPLGLLLFQQFSFVGLLANALAIPWVTLVVTPLAMLGVLLPPLWDIAAASVQGLGAVLEVLAGWPFATFSAAAPPVWAAATGTLGGVLLAMRLPWRLRVLGLPLVLPALLWQPVRPAAGDFDLLAADVGQGNAVLVRTATHSLLYDTGPRYGVDSDAGQRVLVPLLRALNETLDTVVLSHRDIDHTGGAPAVLATQARAALRSSIEEGHPLRQLRPVDRCIAGQRWRWDGVDFEMLHPTEGDYLGFTRPNAVSCVLRIGNGRATALLAGDVELAQESALVARGVDLRADLLLVPHHGSKTSSSAAWLDAVQPHVALVQAGYRNRFGHPAGEVLGRYAARGIAVFDSAKCGAARWSSTEPGDVRCERIESRRYWHHVPR